MSCASAFIRVILSLAVPTFLAATALAQTSPPPSKVELIELKNGDRITGDVIAEDENSVRLKTRWNAELSLPKSEIGKREVQAAAAPPVVVAPPPVVAEPVQVVAAPVAPARPKGVWKGNILLSADLRESTVSSYLYSANARVNYARGNWNNAADYRYSYGKSGNTLSANRMDGTLKTDLDLGQEQEWFVYSLGGAGYDEVRKIDHQFEFGPGLGRHVLVRTNMALNAEVGLSYQQQNFSNGTKREEMRLRLAEDYFWRFNSKLTLEQKTEIQPAFDDLSDYRFRFETTISYALFNNVSWNVSVIDLYDSQPAAGVSNNDLQVRSGLGFSF